jgi:hypothetical protein
VAYSEGDPFRFLFRHGDARVVANFGEDGVWHVHAGGRSTSSLFLDHALASALNLDPVVAIRIATEIISRLGRESPRRPQ